MPKINLNQEEKNDILRYVNAEIINSNSQRDLVEKVDATIEKAENDFQKELKSKGLEDINIEPPFNRLVKAGDYGSLYETEQNIADNFAKSVGEYIFYLLLKNHLPIVAKDISNQRGALMSNNFSNTHPRELIKHIPGCKLAFISQSAKDIFIYIQSWWDEVSSLFDINYYSASFMKKNTNSYKNGLESRLNEFYAISSGRKKKAKTISFSHRGHPLLNSLHTADAFIYNLQVKHGYNIKEFINAECFNHHEYIRDIDNGATVIENHDDRIEKIYIAPMGSLIIETKDKEDTDNILTIFNEDRNAFFLNDLFKFYHLQTNDSQNISIVQDENIMEHYHADSYVAYQSFINLINERFNYGIKSIKNNSKSNSYRRFQVNVEVESDKINNINMDIYDNLNIKTSDEKTAQNIVDLFNEEREQIK